MFKRVNERFGRCDVLINNAGATRAGNFLELSDDLWPDGFALKFFGAVRLTRLFWPLLKAAEGHVVNIIGGAARTVEPEFLIGGSVNAATANFTKGLSKLGMRDGVHVNAIHPGQTATERTELLIQQRAAAQGKIGRGDARRHARQERHPPHGHAARISPRSRCSCARTRRGTSRARRSRSTAEPRQASIEELHLCERRSQGACARTCGLVS